MATCKGFLDCLLKLLNFLITFVGLAFVGYGIYLFVEYRRTSSEADGYSYGRDKDAGFTELGRPLLMAVSLGGVYENLLRAWFIYGLTVLGPFSLSYLASDATATKNGFRLNFVQEEAEAIATNLKKDVNSLSKQLQALVGKHSGISNQQSKLKDRLKADA